MDRREQMRRWLELREERGLTFRELSERTGVAPGTLACWAWKLRQESAEPQPKRGGKSAFVELVPVGGDAVGRVEVVTKNERRLLVDASIAPEVLERLVSALERC
jgi:hypothetical protein